MAKDLWELESDIFTDYEGTITEASFQFNEYGGQAKFVFDEIDGREQPTFEFYKLPPGWESVDGGETIQRVTGDDKGIVKSSQWGKWLGAAGSLDGVREAVGQDAPVNALAWIGCRFRMEVTELGVGKPYKFKDKETGEEKEGVGKDKNYPVAFLGKDQTSANTSPASTGSGNGKVDNLSVLSDLHNPVLENQIVELAGQLDYQTWFGQSFKLINDSGVNINELPDLLTAMGNRGLYESLGGKA